MKYFTKYLPVEGELKEGDKIFFRVDNTRGLLSEKDLPKWVIDKGKLLGYKSGKLFLCSRDIQVGDTYQFNVGYAAGEKVATQDDVRQIDTEFEPFKVIGEISPNAIWAKEGDELGEDQVQMTLNEVLSQYFIQIKCPTCGTFH